MVDAVFLAMMVVAVGGAIVALEAIENAPVLGR